MQDLGQSRLEVIDTCEALLTYYNVSIECNSLRLWETKFDTTTTLRNIFKKEEPQTRPKILFNNHNFRFPTIVKIPEAITINLTIELKSSLKNLSLQQRIARQLKQNFGIAIEDFLWRFYPLSFEGQANLYAVSLIARKDFMLLKQRFEPFYRQFENGLFYITSLFAHLAFFERILTNSNEKNQSLTIFAKGLTRYIGTRENEDTQQYFFKDFFRPSETNKETNIGADLSQAINLAKNSKYNLIIADPEQLSKIKEHDIFSRVQTISPLLSSEEVYLSKQLLLIGLVLCFFGKNCEEISFKVLKAKTFFYKKVGVTKSKVLATLLLALLTFLGYINGLYIYRNIFLIKELHNIKSVVQTVEDKKNKFDRLQNQALILQTLKDMNQSWSKTFLTCHHAFSKFDIPIWVDNLKFSTHNDYRLSEKGVSLYLPNSPFGGMLPNVRKVITMQGKVLGDSLSVEELKRRFLWCLQKTKTLNGQKSLNVMNLNMKPKASRPDETEFVCSLMLEPEDYL